MCELATLGGRNRSLSPSKTRLLGTPQVVLALVQAPANLLEPRSSITALRVEVPQHGGHRLASKNGMDSFGEQVNGCPKTSRGHVLVVYDHRPI